MDSFFRDILSKSMPLPDKPSGNLKCQQMMPSSATLLVMSHSNSLKMVVSLLVVLQIMKVEKNSPFSNHLDQLMMLFHFLNILDPKLQFKCDPEKNKTSFCDFGLGSIKSMRTYKENGIEKVVGIAKGTSFIVLNVSDGSLDKYANPTPNSNGKTAMPSTDSNTDIEVEFNAAGQAVFVITGIHAGIDTVSKGCDNKGNVIDPETGKKACATIEGHISKWKPDLSGMEWQTSFNDFTGGVGGYVAACGQGIEGCQVAQLAQSLVNQCKTDPRSNWRGAAVAVGTDGKMDWYRLDNR